MFLAEYRKSLKKEVIYELPPVKMETASFTSVPFPDYPSLSMIKSLTEMPYYSASQASKAIDFEQVVAEAGSPPDYTPHAPDIDLEKLLSLKGLIEMVGTGKAWIIPTTLGFAMLIFSMLYGYFLIQEGKQITAPNNRVQ